MVTDLLLSSASSWINGGRTVLLAPTSFPSSPVPEIAAPLEVALPFGPCLRFGGGAAPVHHMGGGPRTFPGGVTKWQWRRMQLKKSRQIEKARLLREKHIYEARRRAELLAVSPSLEMPWQKMSRIRPPNYISSDEQVTKLAARFQKRGAEDLWTERDGPESFEDLNEESLPHFSTTVAYSQDANQYNAQNWAQPNLQGNRVQDAGPTYYPSFRHKPPLGPDPSPHSEASYQGRSRRPQTQSDEQWNRVQDAWPSSYSQYTPRIRPGPIPHPDPVFRRNLRRPPS
ncbi:hypothetical protein GOP47_0020253 [Adiantum capillus-veneris]|uniref:Uncharacterized protein n=1 Tax=Adiantum capillus-veneris TaxID=13818 RepID=A0A9D4Z7V4_ADICA|nr:hypothetical protein GOP47_0020253 [Adiantum capillus-veneris]